MIDSSEASGVSGLQSREGIAPYMPHSGEMILLDRVVEYSGEHIVTEVEVGARLPCFEKGAVPAYLGLEVMAQSIAVWSGLRRGEPGSRPPIGFLLGTRRFSSILASFDEGSVLTVRARQVVENIGMAVFECELLCRGVDGRQAAMAVARVSIYSMDEEEEGGAR